MASQQYEEQQGPGAFKTVVHWLWRLFSSMRLAVILMLVIAGLSLVGALLIQVPWEMARDPQLYSYWIDTVARSKVGALTPVLSALGLFDVFHSYWFIVTGALLMLNILVCSVNRWRGIRLNLQGGVVRHQESFYAIGSSCAELATVPLPVAEAARISEKVLRLQSYRTRTETDENNVYIAADKNRYYRLGTYFSHLSLILFVLSFIAGSYFGFRDSSFTVPVGSTREIGHDTGLSLQLSSYVDEYYDSGRPKDYRSQVVLYEDGQIVRQALIRVNHPLVYKGIRFYQAYFGPAARILVRDKNGRDIFSENVPLDSSFNVQGYRYFEGLFDLEEVDLSARLIRSAAGAYDPMIPAGQLAVGVKRGSEQIDLGLIEPGIPRIVGGLEFTFLEESEYSGFQVRHDPTNTLIWIASVMFIIGICAVLYFPYRQVWILSQPLGQGNSRLLIRTLSPRSYRSTSDLNTLANQIEKEMEEDGNV